MAMCSTLLHTLIRKVVKFYCLKLRGCNSILNTSHGLFIARYSHHYLPFIPNILENLEILMVRGSEYDTENIFPACNAGVPILAYVAVFPAR